MNNIDLEFDSEKTIIPRRRATSEIKLLRVELIPKGKTPCEDIGSDWAPAQPAENLSPYKAAVSLGVETWAPQSVVKKRYKILQLRYPPDQFVEKHIEWRPSADLLSIPRARLNWFWQSGFIPYPESKLPFQQDLLWDRESVEDKIESKTVIARLLNQC